MCDGPQLSSESGSWGGSSSSSFVSGLSRNSGDLGGVLVVPDLVNALDFLRNVVSAWMPFVVPRMTGRAIVSEGFRRILRCWAYLGQSQRICSLVCSVVLLQGHVVASSRWGRNLMQNSPV